MEKAKAVPRVSKSEAYDAMARCKAVLSVWTEARKPSEVCRELGLKWMTFDQWQKRALEGMLQALEPRVNLEKGPSLPPKLQRMLERESTRLQTLSTDLASRKLAKRLQRIGKAQDTMKQEDSQAVKA